MNQSNENITVEIIPNLKGMAYKYIRVLNRDLKTKVIRFFSSLGIAKTAYNTSLRKFLLFPILC